MMFPKILTAVSCVRVRYPDNVRLYIVYSLSKLLLGLAVDHRNSGHTEATETIFKDLHILFNLNSILLSLVKILILADDSRTWHTSSTLIAILAASPTSGSGRKAERDSIVEGISFAVASM